MKNSDGSTRIVIHKENKKIDLDEEKKEEVLQLIAPRIPAEAMEEAKRQLPDALNAIWAIDVLPDGHLAVIRITGLESVEIDIFDREGRLAATILPSEEIPDLREVFFFKDTIGVIAESEEKNIFIEYRVKNLKGIYN